MTMTMHESAPTPAVRAAKAREILDEMTLQTEAAIVALSDGDTDRLNLVLEGREQLLARADALLGSLRRGMDRNRPDPVVEAAGILDAAMRLQSVSRRLQHSVEQRRGELLGELEQLDAQEAHLGAYGRTRERSARRIDIMR